MDGGHVRRALQRRDRGFVVVLFAVIVGRGLEDLDVVRRMLLRQIEHLLGLLRLLQLQIGDRHHQLGVRAGLLRFGALQQIDALLRVAGAHVEFAGDQQIVRALRVWRESPATAGAWRRRCVPCARRSAPGRSCRPRLPGERLQAMLISVDRCLIASGQSRRVAEQEPQLVVLRSALSPRAGRSRRRRRDCRDAAHPPRRAPGGRPRCCCPSQCRLSPFELACPAGWLLLLVVVRRISAQVATVGHQPRTSAPVPQPRETGSRESGEQFLFSRRRLTDIVEECRNSACKLNSFSSDANCCSMAVRQLGTTATQLRRWYRDAHFEESGSAFTGQTSRFAAALAVLVLGNLSDTICESNSSERFSAGGSPFDFAVAHFPLASDSLCPPFC